MKELNSSHTAIGKMIMKSVFSRCSYPMKLHVYTWDVYIHVEKLFPGFFKDLHMDKFLENAVTVTIFEAELCHCSGSISKCCKWFLGSWAIFKVVGKFNLKQN